MAAVVKIGAYLATLAFCLTATGLLIGLFTEVKKSTTWDKKKQDIIISFAVFACLTCCMYKGVLPLIP